jgi:hypothetical protein
MRSATSLLLFLTTIQCHAFPTPAYDVLSSQVRRRRRGRPRGRGRNIRGRPRGSILAVPILPLPLALLPICPSLVLRGPSIIISVLALITSLSRIIPSIRRRTRVDITSAQHPETQQCEQYAYDFHGSSVYRHFSQMTAKTVLEVKVQMKTNDEEGANIKVIKQYDSECRAFRVPFYPLPVSPIIWRTSPIRVWKIWPPVAPIIVPVISSWVMFPVVGFFSIYAYTYLNG